MKSRLLDERTKTMRNPTYVNNYQAHLIRRGYLDAVVVLPDHVATHQKEYDGRTFWALRTPRGLGRVRVRLDGAVVRSA